VSATSERMSSTNAAWQMACTVVNERRVGQESEQERERERERQRESARTTARQAAYRDNQLAVLLAQLLFLAQHLQRHAHARGGQSHPGSQADRPHRVVIGIKSHHHEHAADQRAEGTQHGHDGRLRPDLPQHREVHVQAALEDHQGDAEHPREPEELLVRHEVRAVRPERDAHAHLSDDRTEADLLAQHPPHEQACAEQHDLKHRGEVAARHREGHQRPFTQLAMVSSPGPAADSLRSLSLSPSPSLSVSASLSQTFSLCLSLCVSLCTSDTPRLSVSLPLSVCPSASMQMPKSTFSLSLCLCPSVSLVLCPSFSPSLSLCVSLPLPLEALRVCELVLRCRQSAERRGPFAPHHQTAPLTHSPAGGRRAGVLKSMQNLLYNVMLLQSETTSLTFS
jgi:hypothetical protein